MDCYNNIIIDREMCVMTDGHVLACSQVCQWNVLCYGPDGGGLCRLSDECHVSVYDSKLIKNFCTRTD